MFDETDERLSETYSSVKQTSSLCKISWKIENLLQG